MKERYHFARLAVRLCIGVCASVCVCVCPLYFVHDRLIGPLRLCNLRLRTCGAGRTGCAVAVRSDGRRTGRQRMRAAAEDEGGGGGRRRRGRRAAAEGCGRRRRDAGGGGETRAAAEGPRTYLS